MYSSQKPKSKRRPRGIRRSQLSTLRMVAGGEDNISKVIMNGNVHQWVGIGWVDEGKASKADEFKYPRVLD